MAIDKSRQNLVLTFIRGDQSEIITFELHGKEHLTLHSLSLQSRKIDMTCITKFGFELNVFLLF